MKSLVFLSIFVLIAGVALGTITPDVYAQDDTRILLKIAKNAQDQINNQISTNPSDQIKKLFDEGTQKIISLEQAIKNDDTDSAKEHFLSAMKIFTKISRELETSENTLQTETDSVQVMAKNPSNDLKRLQVYLNNLKTIADKHRINIDFSVQDNLFLKAKQQINDHQFILALETIDTIKESIVEVNKKLREESSVQASERAQKYAQKYLEKLDRLIQNAKNQGVEDIVIEELELSKQNLTLAQHPSEIIKEIRKILLIKEKYELTSIDVLESKVLQIEKTLSRLSALENIDQDALSDARATLKNIKTHLFEGKFDVADVTLTNLAKQLETIKNSIS